MRNASTSGGNYNENVGKNYYELHQDGCHIFLNIMDSGLIRLCLDPYLESLNQLDKLIRQNELKELNKFANRSGINLQPIFQQVRNKGSHNANNEKSVFLIDFQGSSEPVLEPQNNQETKGINLQMPQPSAYQELKESLNKRDYTLFIDKSASMIIKDQPGGKSRWEAIKESTIGLAAFINEYDSDGIKVYIFGSNFKPYYNVDEQKVVELFKHNKPLGTTNLSGALKDGLDDYFKRKGKGQVKEKGEIFLVVTDGIPNNPNEVIKVIVEASNKVEHQAEIGITFIRIGSDPEAEKFLNFIDDELVKKRKAKFDICDTVDLEDCNQEKVSLEEVLIRALSD